MSRFRHICCGARLAIVAPGQRRRRPCQWCGQPRTDRQGYRHDKVQRYHLTMRQQLVEAGSYPTGEDEVIEHKGQGAHDERRDEERDPAQAARGDGEDDSPDHHGDNENQDAAEGDRRAEFIEQQGARAIGHMRDGVEWLKDGAVCASESNEEAGECRRGDEPCPHSLIHPFAQHRGKKRQYGAPYKGSAWQPRLQPLYKSRHD